MRFFGQQGSAKKGLDLKNLQGNPALINSTK
jgi:hypothetical protein